MLLIKNGRVVDPKSGLDTQADVLVGGKKVVKIAENIEAGDAQVIDATGLVVAPGLVDIHVHFREPGLTRKADIESESRAAAYGGVTSYMEMPNTVPQTTELQAWKDKRKLGAEKSHVNYSFFYGATNDNVDSFAQLERAEASPNWLRALASTDRTGLKAAEYAGG